MVSLDFTLAAWVQDAERMLIDQDYYQAEKISRRALDSLTAAQQQPCSPDQRALGDRAAIVLLQALYETNRFSSARPCLAAAFSSLEASPPTTLLLWLSLALDTDEACAAQSLMLRLLQGGTQSGTSTWTRQQYISLLHLYVIEVLLPALRDPSEVLLWLRRQTFPPLDPRERQYLEDEVIEAAAGAPAGPSAADAAAAGTHRRSSSRGGSGAKQQPPFVPSLLLPGVRKCGDGMGQGGNDEEERARAEREENRVMRSMSSMGLASAVLDLDRSSSARSPLPELTPPSSARWAGDGGIYPEAARGQLNSQPILEHEDSLSELDALGRWQRAAFDVASAAYHGTSELMGWLAGPITKPSTGALPSSANNTNYYYDEGSGASSSTSALPVAARAGDTTGAVSGAGEEAAPTWQAATVAAATAVVAYAAFLERESIKRGARMAMGLLLGGGESRRRRVR